jgi:N-acetylmuramoyl-L-alanine amidase
MPDGRRRFLTAVPGALLALDLPRAHGATVVAVRVWPAKDYTRVTLELDEPLRISHFTVAEPARLVVDLEGVELDTGLRDIVAKVQPNDPYIAAVRVGQNRPRVARLVFDLRTSVAPQVFMLAPIAAYKHRVVLDLHPSQPPDPLADLIEQTAAGGTRGAGGAPAQGPGGRGDPMPGTPGTGGGTGGAGAAMGRAPAAGAAAARGQVGGAGGAEAGAPRAGGGADASAARAGGGADDPLAGLLRERDPALQARADTSRGRSRGPGTGVVRMVTVAIDPGHGGEDPGAVGRYGTLEKDVVLAVAFRLRERINGEPDMRAFMTRDSDYFVPLATRVNKARAVSADLFVSIHADAFVLPHARGSSVFVLSDRSASSVGARWLASRENRADLIGGVNLPRRNREVASVLLDLSTTAQIQHSRRLGAAVLGELRGIGDLHKIAVEQAAFAVLRAPDIPSILVETAFISNPDEERKLRDGRYQARLADAIFVGIRRYFQRHPPGPRGRTA